jgi:hypothetical protein
MKKYNRDHLVSVEVNDFELCHWYEWKDGISFLGLTLRKAGVYCIIGSDVCQLNDNLVIKNKNIYYKPNCVLNFADDSKQTYWFEDHKSALEFYENGIYFGNFIH